jgi:PmbA protein
MLAAAKSVDDRISIDSGRFEAVYGEKAIANSLGVEGVEGYTGTFYDIGIHAVEGSNVSSVDYRMDGSRSLKGDTSEAVTRKLAESVIESLEAKKMESCTGTLVLSPLATMEILISPIFFSVDADNVQKGISRFANKKSEKVAVDFLTIIDDGTISGGLSSSAFDREGVPHSRMPIIEKGELKAFLYDQYTANKEHIESTGHASGGPRGVPSIDATNIQVSPGKDTVDQLISSVRKGLYVQRFSGRVDSVSGDFSGIAKMSRKIDSGALSGVVRETMISGNVYEVLMNLQAVSKETEKILDFVLPHFVVSDITITSE